MRASTAASLRARASSTVSGPEAAGEVEASAPPSLRPGPMAEQLILDTLLCVCVCVGGAALGFGGHSCYAP